ncbi:uncharacterized protein LOC143884719 [Tasmannia lanceolata]|uniref:uncharacterized protein LOC143884719 n=1 Tax=Tasmannia lanceolata TaxID=3420 RepID=UPI0040648C38
MSANMVPLLCAFGGDFVCDAGKVYYKGGKTRLTFIHRNARYIDLLSKVYETCMSLPNIIINVKYKYPNLQLDSPFVSIENDGDVRNMMQIFPQGSSPVEIFVSAAESLSIPAPTPRRDADNGSIQEIARDLDRGNLANTANLDGRNQTSTAFQLRAHTENISTASIPIRSPSNPIHDSDNGTVQATPADLHVRNQTTALFTLEVGQEFADAATFRNVLREYALRSNFEYKPIRTGRYRFTATCVDDKCSWRIHASEVRGKSTFKIKTLNSNHTCKHDTISSTVNPAGHRQASGKWVADFIMARRETHSMDYTLREIIGLIKREFGITLSGHKARRARELVLEAIRHEETIDALRGYCKEIEKTNPGSVARFCKLSDSFGLFAAYDAPVRGFVQGCRPLVCMKASPRCMKRPYVLLYALGIDAQNEMFPVACGAVEAENRESWLWFCEGFASILGRREKKLTILSNREGGVLEAVSNFFPDVYHGYLHTYLLERLQLFDKHNEHDLLGEIFVKAAHAGTRPEFYDWMYKIFDRCQEGYEWLLNVIKPEYWAASHLEVDRYTITWDIEKRGLDAWVDDETRDLSIVPMMEYIRAKMADSFLERHRRSLDCSGRLASEPQFHVGCQDRASLEYDVHQCSPTVFEIVDVGGSHRVDLVRRSCSCCRWQIEKWPCSHAIAAIRSRGEDVYDYCDDCFTLARYRATYAQLINPVFKDYKNADVLTTKV